MDIRHPRKWFISSPLHTTKEWRMQCLWQRHWLIALFSKYLPLKFLWIDQDFWLSLCFTETVLQQLFRLFRWIFQHTLHFAGFFSTSCTGSASNIVRQEATVTLSKKYEMAEIQYAQHSRWKNSMKKDSQINCQLWKTAGVNTRCMHGIIYPGTCTTKLWIVLKQLLYF